MYKRQVWGNWAGFVHYTKQLLPSFLPDGLVNLLAIAATVLEVLLGVLLLIPFKTQAIALLSGLLLLLFGLSMAFSLHLKAPLDYSVFTASAAAFALSLLHRKEP